MTKVLVKLKGNFGAGEVFFHKVYLIYLEALSVQVFQATGIGGKGKGQFVGIQGLIVPVKPLIQLAILAVTQQGMAGMGELGADLMGTACDQFTFYQGKAVFGSQGLIIGLTAFAACLGGVRYKDPVFLGILEKVTLQTAVTGLWCAFYDG